MIALYSRVSTQEQAREGYSIGEQEERLADYCKSRGWKNYKHFTDAGFSGANMNRPALQQILALIKKGDINRIIVYKLDRLSRSQKDTLELLEEIFLPNNIDFISLNENIDTSSAFGKAAIGLLSCFSQLERETIKERSALGREARAKIGKWIGSGTPPIGYDYENGELKMNEYEAMQVREIHRLYQSGFSFNEITDRMNQKGMVTKYGEWKPLAVKRIITNRLYIGFIKFNDSEYQGIHTPLIDEDTYNASMMIYRKKFKNHTRASDDSYFAGKIFCARCGAKYARKMFNKKTGTVSYYVCYSRSKTNKSMMRASSCDNTIYRKDVFDEAIFDELRSLTLSEVEEYRQESQEDDSVAILEKQIQKFEQQKSRLIDLYSLGTFNAEMLEKKVAVINASISSIEEQIGMKTNKRSMTQIGAAVRSIGDIIDQGEPSKIRRLVDALIDHIDIDGDDITIYWDFE